MKSPKDLGISETPWSVGDGVHADSRHEIRSDRTVLATLNWKSPECEANANLIAAAPELYEALLEMYEQMCGHCDLYQQCHEYTEDGIWAPCNMMINAKEALHKACPDTAETEKDDDSPF